MSARGRADAQGLRPRQGSRRHARHAWPRTVTQGAATVQYPHEKEAPPHPGPRRHRPREENCTVCMLCARSCPDWCIYIEGHKEKAPPRRPGGKPRTVARSTASTSTTRCACTAASASRSARSTRCSGARSTSTPSPASPTCSTTRTGSASGWRPCPRPRARGRRRQEGQEVRGRPEHRLRHHRRDDGGRRHPGRHHQQRRARRAVAGRSCSAGAAAQYVLLAAEFVAVTQVLVYIGAIDGAVPLRHHAHPRPDRPGAATSTTERLAGRAPRRAGALRHARLRAHRRLQRRQAARPIPPSSPSQNVSDSIFWPYLIPFWALSFVLLAALIGAIVLARKD